jgi:hypothetical protein
MTHKNSNSNSKKVVYIDGVFDLFHIGQTLFDKVV